MPEDAFARFQRDFERFANDQAAETEATRAILEALIVLVFGTFPKGNQLIRDLEAIALQPLKDARQQATDDDARRKADLVLERASNILRYLTARVAEAQAGPPRSN